MLNERRLSLIAKHVDGDVENAGSLWLVQDVEIVPDQRLPNIGFVPGLLLVDDAALLEISIRPPMHVSAIEVHRLGEKLIAISA